MQLPNKKLAFLVACALVPTIGAGAALGMHALSKAEEVSLKQDMAERTAKTDVATSKIGIFNNAFEDEIEDAKRGYRDALGQNGFTVLAYRNFTLLVPSEMGEKDIADAKTEVDVQNDAMSSKAPSQDVVVRQIESIRDVFKTDGPIEYDSFIGAYTDEKGFQYNFEDGTLVGKQVGITSALSNRFSKAYPHFAAEGVVELPASSRDVAIGKTAAVVKRLSALRKDASFNVSPKIVSMGGTRLGLTFGDNLQVLTDTVTGDIIHLSLRR